MYVQTYKFVYYNIPQFSYRLHIYMYVHPAVRKIAVDGGSLCFTP